MYKSWRQEQDPKTRFLKLERLEEIYSWTSRYFWSLFVIFPVFHDLSPTYHVCYQVLSLKLKIPISRKFTVFQSNLLGQRTRDTLFYASLTKNFSFQIAIADAESLAQLVTARGAVAVVAESNFEKYGWIKKHDFSLHNDLFASFIWFWWFCVV